MRKILAAYLLLVASFVQAAGSGTGCETTPPTPEAYSKAIQLGYQTQLKLEQLHAQNGDTVVLISRAGSNTPDKRFNNRVGEFWRYTHAGLAFRDHPNGQWSVVHLLNTCNESSDIFVQGLMRFSLDKPVMYSNAIGLLHPLLQVRLNEVVLQSQLSKAMHEGDDQYSSISSPYNLIYQNSNEYILTLLGAAIAPAEQQPMNADQSKQFFLTSGMHKAFTPEIVKVGFLERVGKAVGVGPGNARLDDHTKKERRKGPFEMVSAGSLYDMLAKMGLLTDSFEIAL